MSIDSLSFEKHYRIGELAELWSLGRETVRRLVKDDPGSSRFVWGGRERIQSTAFPSLLRAEYTRDYSIPVNTGVLRLKMSTCNLLRAAINCDDSRLWPFVESFLQHLR